MSKLSSFRKALAIVTIVVGGWFALNVDVSTRQGVNWVVYEKKIPLYLKSLSFITRHYQMQQLTENIIHGADSDRERVDRLFRWTLKNIKPTPPSLPVVDDHPWHIVVRGYGESDQMNDIFSLLCSYADVESFYDVIERKEAGLRHALAFVFLSGHWMVFDAWNGLAFGLNDIKRGKFKFFRYDNRLSVPAKEYYRRLMVAYSVNRDKLSRNRAQMPSSRLWMELVERI